MITLRYTLWDGSQRIEIDADKVFERLSELLSYTDDVRQALEWLLRQGIDDESLRIQGLDDFLEALRDKIREPYSQYNLEHVFDDKQRRLDELVDLEQEALREKIGEQPGLRDKQTFLEQLPRGLRQALERLGEYAFEDEDARRDFEALREDLDRIRELDDLKRRYGEMFEGPQSLDFEAALDVLRQLQRLHDLEDQLMEGRLDAVDASLLGQALGEAAMRGFRDLERMMATLRQAGYLTSREGKTEISPKGVRRIGQLALRDIFQGLVRDRGGAHGTDHRGFREPKPEATRAYQFGDPMNLDLVATLKKSLARRPGVPLDLRPEDFEVVETNLAVTTSTVLLLDMSWSMSWEGRFAAAKKVAIALETLIRSRFPRDYFGIVGFYTRAVELKPRDLPEASWNMGDPFTNLQDGLRLATQLLDRHASNNQQIIVITDGQPTAYFSKGRLYCEWPLSFGGISLRAARETLKEVERVTRKNIRINTFMLDDSPSLRAFVESMTRINRGRALYTQPDHLGDYLLVDYLSGKRRRG